jgi:hypothetical protein
LLDLQIEKAHADRGEVAELCRLLAGQPVIVIGSWADAEATRLLIQDFKLQGRAFIPLFSDETHFWAELGSTPFWNKGLAVECKSLMSILHGDELLILNPGSRMPVQLCKADFEPYLGRVGVTA